MSNLSNNAYSTLLTQEKKNSDSSLQLEMELIKVKIYMLVYPLSRRKSGEKLQLLGDLTNWHPTEGFNLLIHNIFTLN